MIKYKIDPETLVFWIPVCHGLCGKDQTHTAWRW